MLTGRRAAKFAAAVLLAVTADAVAAAPAVAVDGDCHWEGTTYVCNVGTDPTSGGGHDGGGGGGGGSNTCTFQGMPYPCNVPGLGYFNGQDGCYYRAQSPQPPLDDPVWGDYGATPGVGAFYFTHCVAVGGPGDTLMWLPTPPPGQPGTISPAELAQRAIAQMHLAGAAIGRVPRDGGHGTVGIPVWLWTEATPTTWGPIQITAAVPGLSVTAHAQATKIVWSMGDGHSITCTTPGTQWTSALGTGTSPDCGYTYSTPSRSRTGGQYTITATTTWAIHWWVVGGGQTGDEDATRTSTTTIIIDDLQVVTS